MLVVDVDEVLQAVEPFDDALPAVGWPGLSALENWGVFFMLAVADEASCIQYCVQPGCATASYVSGGCYYTFPAFEEFDATEMFRALYSLIVPGRWTAKWHLWKKRRFGAFTYSRQLKFTTWGRSTRWRVICLSSDVQSGVCFYRGDYNAALAEFRRTTSVTAAPPN